MIQYKEKEFYSLNLQELYNILQLREEVFVIEQNCIYQDIDNYDFKAFHILGYHHNTLIAYARVLPPNTYFKEVSIGRVIIKKSYRNKKLGHQLIQKCIQYCHINFTRQKIKISAQKHLTEFYIQHGFQAKGNTYLEDGIPHIAMYR